MCGQRSWPWAPLHKTLRKGKAMRVNHLIKRARHGIQTAYEMARVAGGKLNNFIDTSARVYGGVVQPILNQYGIDTRDTDAALMGYYRQYDGVRNMANKFDGLIKV
jgi:hypothetical protein